MKKILMLALVIILIGCSKSDENSSILKSSIIGKWRLDKIVELCSTGHEGDYVYRPTICEKKSQYEFNQDGTVTYNGFNDNGNDLILRISIIARYFEFRLIYFNTIF